MSCQAADRLTSAAELRREVEELLVREMASGLETRRGEESAASPSRVAARKRWRWIVFVGAGAVVLGGAAAAVLWRNDRGRSASAPDASAAHLGPRSVAVLPFVNASSDPENEYFSDGMTEELIDALTRVRGLRVTSRSSSFAFKGSRLGARAIGDSLGVQMILEGSVRKAGTQLRINTQLTRVTDGSAIWSQGYERELRDVFKVQEELARSILGALQTTIGDSTSPLGIVGASTSVPLVRHTTTDREAYDFYLRGRYFWNRRTHEGFTRAVSYFNEAIARDSTFAAAWAGLADSNCILANFGFRPAHDVCPRSAEAARRALMLDSTLAEAHASLGFVNLFYYWKFDEAERELQKAIALDSTYANAYLWLNHLAWVRGDTNAAIGYARKASPLEPLSLILRSRLGSAFWRAGRFDESEEQLRYTLDMDPSFGDARQFSALVKFDRGKLEEGVAEMERVGRREWVAYAYARAGRRDDALRITRDLEAMAGRGEWVSPIRVARIFAALRNPDSAFAWLERSYVAREPDTIFTAYDPYFIPLRGDARFAALTRRIATGADSTR